MRHDQPDGFVVVPVEPDGSLRGNALWCADQAEVEETLAAWAPAVGLLMYRSTETEPECPPKSSPAT